MTYKNTSLVCQSNFVAVIASYLHVFNTHSIKANTTTHVLKLFLTSKRKLHEVTHEPRSLSSFAEMAEIGGEEPTFKKEKKGFLGTEGNATAFSMLPTQLLQGFYFYHSQM